MKKPRYILITVRHAAELQKLVNEHMEKGWTPLGGPCISEWNAHYPSIPTHDPTPTWHSGTTYTQALVWKGEKC